MRLSKSYFVLFGIIGISQLSMHAMKPKTWFSGAPRSTPVKQPRSSPPKSKDQIRTISQQTRGATSLITEQSPRSWQQRITQLLQWRPALSFAPIRRFFFGPPLSETVAALWQTFETIATGWHYDPYKIPDIKKYREYINSPRPSDGKTILTVACEAYVSTYQHYSIQPEILRYIKLFIELGAHFGIEPQKTVRMLLKDQYLILLNQNDRERQSLEQRFAPLDVQMKIAAKQQGLDYDAIDTEAQIAARQIIAQKNADNQQRKDE